MSYLNTVPLVWGLLHGRQQHLFHLDFQLPAICADSLADRTSDIGIVPAVELLRLPLQIIKGTGIACIGPVRSILLISRVPIEQIRTVATDTSSRTSVQLTRIILAERYGVDPQLLPYAPQLQPMLQTADAALIIGDPALLLDPETLPYHVLDLGQEWFELTGLPMVFAVWACQNDMDAVALEQPFQDSYRYGRDHIEEIVASEHVRRGITPELAREYLQRYIRFELGETEYEGLRRFLDFAARLKHHKEWEQQRV